MTWIIFCYIKRNILELKSSRELSKKVVSTVKERPLNCPKNELQLAIFNWWQPGTWKTKKLNFSLKRPRKTASRPAETGSVVSFSDKIRHYGTENRKNEKQSLRYGIALTALKLARTLQLLCKEWISRRVMTDCKNCCGQDVKHWKLLFLFPDAFQLERLKLSNAESLGTKPMLTFWATWKYRRKK